MKAEDDYKKQIRELQSALATERQKNTAMAKGLIPKEYLHNYAKDQIKKDREQIITKTLKWVEHDCDNCACGCRGDWTVNNPGEIRDLPIILD